jgi:class 3 adenylate cyclase
VSKTKFTRVIAAIVAAHLEEAATRQIGTGTSCMVFFDAEPDVPYADAIRAIDLIERSPSRVVLLTPQTKRVLIP